MLRSNPCKGGVPDNYFQGKQPQSYQARVLRIRDTCSSVTRHLPALPFPRAIARFLGLVEEKGERLWWTDRRRPLRLLQPTAVPDFGHSRSPELNHSPRVREGERERERTSRKLWDVIDDCEQGGDLGVICSEAVDPLRGRLEGI